MEKKRKFHVVITNNETGEVMMDKQSNGIIAAIEHEEGTAAFSAVNCNAFSFAQLIATAQGICKEVIKMHPEIDLLAKIVAAYQEKERDSEEGADEKADLNDADTD